MLNLFFIVIFKHLLDRSAQSVLILPLEFVLKFLLNTVYISKTLMP